ncbi:MAG TPA: helix-turn-helix domain-containing protein [Bryobacteraceae bacterium]|nr:helix-turn-helix domain-containing protein [Bryobacteraceae bacterium]
MEKDLYSVEQVANLLNLHVRTVRSYVREGKLKAVRIGKQYRIAREDLEAMTGRPMVPLDRAGVPRQRHIEVSSIVEIDAISQELAMRLANMLPAAAKGRPEGDEPLRIETIYNQERARLKVILSGSIASTTALLHGIDFYLEAQK